MTGDTELLEAAQRVDRGSIVVGHDGSPGADQALEEALVLARALGVPLVLVRAWSLVTAPRRADWEFGYVPGYDECAEIVRLALVDDARPAVEGYPAQRPSRRRPWRQSCPRLVMRASVSEEIRGRQTPGSQLF